jgi:hypothetical protein
MINTLIKIGDLIKNDKNGCVEQHPLVKTFILNSDNKKFKDHKDYVVFHINVDTINKTLYFEDNDIPYFDFKNVLMFDTGGKSYPYIFGDFISNVKCDKKENKNYIHKISSNIKDLGGSENTIINIFADILTENIDIINSKIKNIKQYAIKFTIDGAEPLHIDGVVDAINKIYISNITTTKNGNLILNKSLLCFYKTNERLSQSPNFNEDEAYKNLSLTMDQLISLIYSVKVHEKLYMLIDKYMINIIPYYNGITYDVISKIISGEYTNNYKNIISKTIEDAENKLCEFNTELDDSFSVMNIFSKSIKDLEYDELDVSFDIIFKILGSNTVVDISTIRNYRFHKIILINNNISLLKNQLFDCDVNIKQIFTQFYKIHEKYNIDKWNSVIFEYIQKILTGDYHYSHINDRVFTEKCCYIMMNVDKPSFKINELIKQYKFIMYMDENAKKEDMIKIESDSYVLGEMLGNYCKTYQNDRKNLVKFVKLFNGHINQKSRKLTDVFNFLHTFQSKLEMNKCKFNKDELNKINELYMKLLNSKLDSFYFMRGYITSHYTYKTSQEELLESTITE